LSFVEYRRGVTNRRQGALHGWAQRRGFSADIDVSTFGVHRGDFTHDFVANLFIYYERKERGGVSTTRDDRSVGLRRRGKRKAAAALRKELLIFFLIRWLLRKPETQPSREGRGGKKSLARIIHTNPIMRDDRR